ncbi:hypothetical protein NDU88_003448 [Pleurodeles waltl]|uniref:Uncharacterized protein n=1 Tax=Pleurodeles waltl TaxID=8319 RepID=A0AAV7W619_PLEWA|nr:hypothetical protein NDU88_003448 [Pleurodeles waltl]
MSAVVPVSEDAAGLVAVLVAVPVAAVHGSAPAEGQSRMSPAASGSCPLGKRLGTVAEAVDVPGAVHVAESVAAVLAAVSVAAGHGSEPAEEQSRTPPAASDGCPLVKRLGTVAEDIDVPGVVQVAVQVAVQVVVVVAGHLAVFAAVQVGVVVDRRCDTGPSVGATMPSPDLLFCFWHFLTFDGAAVVLPLSPFVFAEPLVAGSFGFSLRDVGTFFTLAGGRMPLPSLRGTLAALMGGALNDPAVAGTTVPRNVVAEVLVWDLESLALCEGRGWRRSIASSLRAAGLTGAGPEVPGAKEMPTLLGERALDTR